MLETTVVAVKAFSYHTLTTTIFDEEVIPFIAALLAKLYNMSKVKLAV